jgi:hypothetical protein
MLRGFAMMGGRLLVMVGRSLVMLDDLRFRHCSS